MGRPKIMVTGVGAVIGFGIIQALRSVDLEVEIIGADADELAVGFHFADRGVTIPRADAPDYTEFLVGYAKSNEVAILIPGIEQDLDRMVKDREAFQGSGFFSLLPEQEVYEVTSDKWKTHLFLGAEGFSTIPTLKLDGDESRILGSLSFPMVFKPRTGFAGKGLVEIHDREAFRFFRKRVDPEDYIVQEKVGSDQEEFTCGSYISEDGRLFGPVVLRRALGYGSTIRATCEEHPDLEDMVNSVLTALGAHAGPYCTQMRLSSKGPVILEINARFSSSTSIKAMMGFNEPEMLVRELLFDQAPKGIRLAYGKTVNRYLADHEGT